MTQAKKTIVVSAPIDRVWEVIGDFSNVDRFHVGVERVTMRTRANRGLGAIRECHLYDGNSVVEEITSWKDGEYFTVELSEMNMPFIKATATMGVRPVDAQRTAVTVMMNYRMKGSIFGWLMGAVMIRPMMQRMFARVIRGLKTHLDTGAVIGQDGRPALVASASA